jgi:tetratricopeptide (TPR) repeat protein
MMEDELTVSVSTETVPVGGELFAPEEIESKASVNGEAGENDLLSSFSKQGYQFLKENKPAEAADCFKAILAQDEGNNYALVGLGDAERKMGNHRAAVTWYQKCLEYHPGNNYALFGMADSYKALNQFHKAIEIWEQYLIHDDRNITVLTRVADAYRKTKEFKKSKAVYLKVLDMENDNPYALIGLGHLHYDFREYREAMLYWSRILELCGESVDIRVLTSIGNCHRKLKTYAEGIPYFEKALQRDPDNFYALFGLADCYRGMNQPDKSLEYWKKILEKDPKNKVILTRAGDALRNMSQFDEAGDYYRQALNIEFDTYAVLGLAIVAKAQGKYTEAIASLRRLIQQDPKDYHFYLELADCLVKNHEKDRAIEVLAEYQMQGYRNAAISEMVESIKA